MYCHYIVFSVYTVENIKSRFFREIVLSLFVQVSSFGGVDECSWSIYIDCCWLLIVDFGVWWRWKRSVSVGIASRRSALLDRKVDLTRAVAAGRQVGTNFRRIGRLTRVSVHARVVTVLRVEVLELVEVARSVLPLRVWLQCYISVRILHLENSMSS